MAVDHIPPGVLFGEKYSGLDPASLLMAGFAGPKIDDDIKKLIVEEKIAGVILFSRNIESIEHVSELVAEIRSLAGKRPFLIAVDQEGGRVSRLPPPFIQLPPMARLGSINDTELTRRIAEALAGELRQLGFNLNFAPVADVNSNPQNPVIGDRSFSDDPALAASHVCAFIDGLQDKGVAACVKHFPGHGDTSQDSHLELPRVEADLERLRKTEFFPFSMAVKREGSKGPAYFLPPYPPAAVMTSHVVYTALDPENPATLSKKIVTELLRDSMGFGGMTATDDLEMKAIDGPMQIGAAAVRAVNAGCDLLLCCKDPQKQYAIISELRRARQKGGISNQRLMEAKRRIEMVSTTFTGEPGEEKYIGSDRHKALADDLASRLDKLETLA